MPASAFGIDEQRTKTLRIDDLDGGAVIYSHDYEPSVHNSPQIHPTNHSVAEYPLSFSCEIVVHAPVENGKIMLIINSFFIPSRDLTCNDNFLYVFDSNTARSKAMPEAGGEQGLCQSTYPKQPIFSSKSYICIAFHTSSANFLRLPNQDGVQAGFKLTVTAFQETQTSSCAAGGFFCGEKYGTRDGAVGTLPTSDLNFDVIHVPPPRIGSPTLGLCVSEQVRCDGLINCPDGRDEAPSLCQLFRADGSIAGDSNSWLSQFLSLGVTTSISISVGVVVCLIVCFGSLACFCCRRYCLLNGGSNGSVGRSHACTVYDRRDTGSSFTVVANQCQSKPPDHSQHPLEQHQHPPPQFVCQQLPAVWAPPPQLPHSNSGGGMQGDTRFCPPPQSQWFAYPSNGKPAPELASDPSTITNTDSFCYSSGEYPSPTPGYLRNSSGAPTRSPQPRWEHPPSNQSTAPNHQSLVRPPVGLHTNTPVGHGSRDLSLTAGTASQVDGGIVYLGEVPITHFRGQKHLGGRHRKRSCRNSNLPRSLVDVHSSSSLGGRAQSATEETRTQSGSSLSIGPSWSSRRSRRRPNRHVTSPSKDKIVFPVEL